MKLGKDEKKNGKGKEREKGHKWKGVQKQEQDEPLRVLKLDRKQI